MSKSLVECTLGSHPYSVARQLHASDIDVVCAVAALVIANRSQAAAATRVRSIDVIF
jgi:hypothetical protein